MATVVPKTIYSTFVHSDIPVWEITTEKKKKLYYERKHRAGYIPIGCLHREKFGSASLEVYDVVSYRAGRDPTPVILRERDGFIAPIVWYEKDKHYTGHDVYVPPGEDDYYERQEDSSLDD